MKGQQLKKKSAEPIDSIKKGVDFREKILAPFSGHFERNSSKVAIMSLCVFFILVPNLIEPTIVLGTERQTETDPGNIVAFETAVERKSNTVSGVCEFMHGIGKGALKLSDGVLDFLAFSKLSWDQATEEGDDQYRNEYFSDWYEHYITLLCCVWLIWMCAIRVKES